MLKPPSLKAGDEGLREFREQAKLHEQSLRNRMSREFYRKDLARWQKLYGTLSHKRKAESESALHFANFSKLCGDLLEEFGAEAPPKRRRQKKGLLIPLSYPDFPDDITHRIHFLEGPALRRQRAAAFSAYAPAVSRQTSGSGRVLLSVGVRQDQVRLYTRLVEAIGDLASGDFSTAGFDIGYVMRPRGIPKGQPWSPNPLNPDLPIARIWNDNQRSRGYGTQARLLGDQWKGVDGEGLPDDLPDQNVHLWDPDPHWQRVLDCTEADRLIDALELVEAVPGGEREHLFDEVMYLRFLTNTPMRAQDIRFLARKHAESSLISGRLLEEFDAFLAHLDEQLATDAPQLEDLSKLRTDVEASNIPSMPAASDWAACQHYLSRLTNPGCPRGRIFSWNLGLADAGASEFFASSMIAAENAFRRERSIPEIGRGWASEVALMDLIRSIWPSALHQWRPAFLGLQSVDIYVPELELAIEYQGKQHYEPVELFGGQEGFEATLSRDQRKRTLLSHHGVQLLEWRYDIPITHAELVSQLSRLSIDVPT